MAAIEPHEPYKNTRYYQEKYLKDMEKLGKELAENGYYMVKGIKEIIKFNVYKQDFQPVQNEELKHIVRHANIYQSDLITNFYFNDAVNKILEQLKTIPNPKAWFIYKNNKKFLNIKEDDKIKEILKAQKEKKKIKNFQLPTNTAQALTKIIADDIITDGSNLYKIENNQFKRIKQINLDFFKQYADDYINLSEDIDNIINNLTKVPTSFIYKYNKKKELKQYRKDYLAIKKTLLHDGLICIEEVKEWSLKRNSQNLTANYF